MSKNKRKSQNGMRNKFLISALVLVGVASIAYAAFSQVLTISGTGSTSGDWDVAITGITRTAATGATDLSAPSFTGTSATFSVELAYPGATATYVIDVANAGTVPAIVTAIGGVTEANAADPTYIDYEFSGIAVNDTLAAAGTDSATVVVTWDPASAPATTGSKTATITIDYAQDTP